MRVGRIQVWHLLVVLACLAIFSASSASAGVSVGIGVGTAFGHSPHPHYHISGWYVRPYCWYDPWYTPWWDPYPVIVVPPPVVRERRIIVEEYKPALPTPPAQAKAESAETLSEKQQQKKSEALKALRIGDELARLQAVEDLGPFAHDSHVRTTLEKSLSKDRSPLVRKAVADLFSRLKDKKTLPALKRAYAEDENRDVRQAAYRAIALIESYAGL